MDFDYEMMIDEMWDNILTLNTNNESCYLEYKLSKTKNKICQKRS